MKTQLNHRNRVCNWLCIFAFACVLFQNVEVRSETLPPKASNGGVIIGATVLVVCGVVVWTMIRTCKKLFPNTNTNTTVWEESCPSFTYDTCPCETNPTNSVSFSENQWIILERSTNLIDWEYLHETWDTLDNFQFEDRWPPSPAFYRVQVL